MRIAYMIHAYNEPRLLARFVRALATVETLFFIHIDIKVDIEPFKNELEGTSVNNIKFVKRENSRWGSIGTVKAVLNAMKEICSSDTLYAFFLSG